MSETTYCFHCDNYVSTREEQNDDGEFVQYCEYCGNEIEDCEDDYEPDVDEAQEWYDFDPDC